MKYILPESHDNYVVVCENCRAIINYSIEDCHYEKELDCMKFDDDTGFENITRVYVRCPNPKCRHNQDVAGRLTHLRKTQFEVEL